MIAMNLEQVSEKWGLSGFRRVISPLSGRAEKEDDFNIRFKYTVRCHSLVGGFLERHDVPFRTPGFQYYDILRMALNEQGRDWDEFWAEHDAYWRNKHEQT